MEIYLLLCLIYSTDRHFDINETVYHRQQNKCYLKMCQIVRKTEDNCSTLYNEISSTAATFGVTFILLAMVQEWRAKGDIGCVSKKTTKKKRIKAVNVKRRWEKTLRIFYSSCFLHNLFFMKKILDHKI